MPSTAEHLFITDIEAAHRSWVVAPSLVLIRPKQVQALKTERTRRVLNVLIAVLALILTLPLMAVIALAIKLTSRGPVIYSQARVGVDRRTTTGGNWRRRVDHGGRLFTMYKFRTMTHAQSNGSQVWAKQDDPRVTPVGRVLRKLRLDELPQLVNVLKGDMNVVGPRPEQPQIFQELRQHIDAYALRQRVLPGITGWAQIHQSYDRCLDDVRNKVRYDLQYLHSATVAQDLRILARTIPVVVLRKGAW
jgi:lipopolysaccharide/colanic/teichoic acid biosynthesis glycosyltransferase